MSVKRSVPNIESESPEESLEFYEEFIGMDVAMNKEWIVTFAAKSNPNSQVNIIRRVAPDIPHPDVSIEVSDIDQMFAKAKEQNIEIVYPITDEPWGVRRFFVKDPNGAIINILSHR